MNASGSTTNFSIATPDGAFQPSSRFTSLAILFDMELILAIARKYNLKVIEDSTEALGSSYRGRSPGLLWGHWLLQLQRK